MGRRDPLEKQAYKLYRSGKYTQKEIAGRVDRSEQTISAWKHRYGWDEQIDAEAVSIKGSINTLRKKFNEWVAALETYDTGVSDAALKHAKTMALLDDTVDPLASTIFVMEHWAHFLEMHHDELYGTFQELLPGFLAHMRNQVEI